jgi:biopolymer transport protein ExbB
MNWILLQAHPVVADSAAVVEEAARDENLLTLLTRGGWVMLPIGFLLLMAIYFFIERYLIIKRLGRVDAHFMMNVMQNVSSGNIQGAKALCNAQQSSLIAHILEKGILRLGSSIQEIESGMESTARASLSVLEKNVIILGAIAALAPMFGFLGTVMGMIRIFGDVAIADSLSIGTISGGIYEKMITSAAGLLVGVIAYVCHTVINMQIEKTMINLEHSASQFVDLLYRPQS